MTRSAALKIALLLVTSAQSEVSVGRAKMVDGAQARLLPGSPFYERQELHRTG